MKCVNVEGCRGLGDTLQGSENVCLSLEVLFGRPADVRTCANLTWRRYRYVLVLWGEGCKHLVRAALEPGRLPQATGCRYDFGSRWVEAKTSESSRPVGPKP